MRGVYDREGKSKEVTGRRQTTLIKCAHCSTEMGVLSVINSNSGMDYVPKAICEAKCN